MIIDAFLGVLQVIVNILLAPLEVINIGIDLVSSIPVVANILSIIAYVLPWNNILPVIFLTFLIINFRNVIAVITAVWNILPFVR